MALKKQKKFNQVQGAAELELRLKNAKKLTPEQAAALVKADHWCQVFNGGKYHCGPDLKELEELSPAVAKEIAGFHCLDLDGLRELTAAAAAELTKLSRLDGYVSLEKITKLAPATAAALAKAQGSLFLDGLKTLPVPAAAALTKHGKKHVKLTLFGLTDISVEAARLLAGRPGCLCLGINKMNPGLARALSGSHRRSCCLQMGHFKSLDLESAQILAESKGWLLFSISKISPELIEVFKKTKGEISMDHWQKKQRTSYYFFNNKVQVERG